MPVDAAQLWTLNHRLLTVVLDACSAELAELGLEAKEFFVLAEVAASPYPAELAARLVIPKASVTVYVRNLVAKGFMRREIDDTDLRRHRLVLTDDGVAARDRAFAALARAFDRRLAAIAPQDRAELQRILLALLEPAPEATS
ncbi:MarR family winged helix-turn-helix transcriptional regulator [Promicromonospora sp. MEB111]|uniref:MarR family winged helix-turn-helix transcriptional regulator n=1 Tax=Promicromonospora sp. MEB111 TaxID=3040301 RepID=UPI00254DBCF9|nr:MarR family winged helix-turn-helix transcriptional regulator [Promicromonospora sp. MEB111]